MLERNIISEDELSNILAKRNVHISNRPSTPKTVYNSEVNGNLHLIAPQNTSQIFINDLVFVECIFKGKIELGDYARAGSIEFRNCSFEENVIIESINNIKLTGLCHFLNNLTVRLSGTRDDEISNINVDKDLLIQGSNSNVLVIKNINLDREIKDQNLVISSHILKKIEVTNIVFASIKLSRTRFESNALFLKINVGKFLFEKSSIESVFQIKDSKVAQEFSIDSVEGEKGLLKIEDNTQISNLTINLICLRNIYISDSIINELKLSDSNKKDDILNIQKSTISKLIFKDVYNNGLLTLRGLTMLADGLISIKSSNIGKTDFIKCDFSKSILEFENSKITEVFFAETNFPKKVRLNNSRNHSQAQLAFGQLQTAFQKQGDTIRSLEYQSREIAEHFYGLKFWSKDFFKTFNLGLNLISNNFGRYWALGILFTFSVGLLLFCALLISTEKYQFGLPDIDCGLIPAYLKFMNPLRFIETDSLFKNNSNENHLKLNEWSYLWDFLGRVFVAYGYYQTIQAFRRFGRK
jgi:hypothetical protein